MSSSAPKTTRYRFGQFELEPAEGRLSRSGTPVKLQDLPFRLLVLLVERPGEIVSREEVRQRLWPEDTFVEFDNSLGVAVRKLREALRDDADAPRFVETVPRRGYRFVAPVTAQDAPDPGILAEGPIKEATPAAADSSSLSSRGRYWTIAALVLSSTTLGEPGSTTPQAARRSQRSATVTISAPTDGSVFYGAYNQKLSGSALYGDGKCISGTGSCELVEIEKGFPETFEYGPGHVRYKFKVIEEKGHEHQRCDRRGGSNLSTRAVLRHSH